MNFRTYVQRARTTAVYESDVYPFLALTEETGEFVGLIAKHFRGDDLTERFGSDEAFVEALKKEAGDVLWCLAMCCEELGIDLEEVAQLNLDKLANRKRRGKIKGAGSDR